MTQAISVETTTGNLTRAALATPAGDGKVGAVIVVHEWWGLNDDIRGLCDRLAAEGYLALAVDLYGGEVATEAEEAMRLVTEMKTATAMTVVGGAQKYLTAHPRSNGKVAVTGFCLGGGIAIAAACTVSGITCGIPFYGLPIVDFQTFSEKTPPLLGHYAQVDGHVTPERVRAVHDKALAAGAKFELHFYEGPHAFMRRADASVYHPASAELAWSRTLAFLKQQLG